MDIIVRKIRKDLGAAEDGVVIGDVRTEMGRDLMRRVEGIINRKSHLDEYYILVVTRPYWEMTPGGISKQVREKLVITLQKPEKTFATICIRVNNRKGEGEVLWVLPRDIPMPDEFVKDGDRNERIADDAKGMPLRG